MSIRSTGRRQRGFTYLGLMFVLALLLLASAAAAVVWSTEKRRDDETELLYVGDQYRHAIERYHARHADNAGNARTSGNLRPWPRRLEDLLEDRDSQFTVRDLRQLYVDPLSGQLDWVLLHEQGGGIIGVASPSTHRPIRQTGFAPGLDFGSAKTYADWRFVAGGAAIKSMSRVDGAQAVSDATVPTAPAGPSPVAPVVSEAPPAVAPAPAPAPDDVEDEDTGPGQSCAQIAAFDQSVCQQQTVKFGAQAGDVCQQSALRRAAACPRGARVDGLQLPQLVFRQR